ncbi:uncharacterized protein EAE97_006910 [Botrytis byssoidea]|uniref:Uncharacterized protein n=1 Tax=Botrytis byssoidea TaxID=139641 RepID=A0A9P5IM37_9HELO|nr:uncharacterized protein EAE97_006910 [Botrytis byssoidea]KAF7940724.1 hypothetical protein EAE97_006910 [Botrytis byssoidea]
MLDMLSQKSKRVATLSLYQFDIILNKIVVKEVLYPAKTESLSEGRKREGLFTHSLTKSPKNHKLPSQKVKSRQAKF